MRNDQFRCARLTEMTDVERAEWSLCEWPWHSAAAASVATRSSGSPGPRWVRWSVACRQRTSSTNSPTGPRSLTQRAVLRLLDPAITAAGVLRADKILDAVRDILGEVTIEDLPIPYTAVTTDLIAGKSVWLQRGPVDAAIRASIAIPGVIAPHILDGRLLADGGILDPLPMAPIAAVNADLTIAVSLSGSEAGGRDEPTEADPRRTTEWLNRLCAAPRRCSTPTRPVPAGHRRHGPCSAASAQPGPESDATSSSTLGRRSGAPDIRVIEPHHRHRARWPAHAGRPTDLLIEVPRTAARSLGIPPRRRGHRHWPRARRSGARCPGQPPNTAFWKADSAAEEVGDGAACRRPCSRPASADGMRHAGSSGLGPNAATDSSSAKTPNADPSKSAISAAASPPNGDGVFLARRHQHHRHLAVGGQRKVDGAAHSAVHVSPAPDRHRRPGARYGATGGHRVDQLDTGSPVECRPARRSRCRSR